MVSIILLRLFNKVLRLAMLATPIRELPEETCGTS
jgi:hypothetical protein